MSSEGPAPRLPTEDEIRSAVADLRRPIRDYRWWVDGVRRRDARTDMEFQRRYNHFWRVRKNATWRATYHELLERAKRESVDFPTALRAMPDGTGRIEASVSSKLVATLDPDVPVTDACVLRFFGLRLPYPYQDDRIGRTIDVFQRVSAGVDAIVRSDAMSRIRAAIAGRYPDAWLTDVTMIDFVLWQVRAQQPKGCAKRRHRELRVSPSATPPQHAGLSSFERHRIDIAALRADCVPVVVGHFERSRETCSIRGVPTARHEIRANRRRGSPRRNADPRPGLLVAESIAPSNHRSRRSGTARLRTD